MYKTNIPTNQINVKQLPLFNDCPNNPSSSYTTDHLNNLSNNFSYAPYSICEFETQVFENSIIIGCKPLYTNHSIHLNSVRGKVKIYSRKSRRRLFLKLSQVNILNYSQVFHCANTFHNTYPNDCERLKKILSEFLHLLKGFEPTFHFFWKLEFQKRQAPHFHFLLFNSSHSNLVTAALVNKIVNDIWMKVTKDNGFFHRKYGTHCSEITDLPHCFKYFCKYCAKEDSEEFIHYAGRRWGYSNKIDFSRLFSFNIEARVLKHFRKHFLDLVTSRRSITNEFRYYLENHNHLQLLLNVNEAIKLFKLSFDEARFPMPPSLELFSMGTRFI